MNIVQKALAAGRRHIAHLERRGSVERWMHWRNPDGTISSRFLRTEKTYTTRAQEAAYERIRQSPEEQEAIVDRLWAARRRA